MALVSLADAKSHLRIDDDDQDAFLSAQLENAEGIVIDYLKDRADETWDENTVPGQVRASVLLVLGALWENREGVGPDAPDLDPISPAVRSLLMRSRDPALA